MAQLSPPERIIDYILGAVKSQALHACTALKIADFVKDGPKSTEELAQLTGVNKSNLHRLLRVLVAMEILAEAGRGSYRATPLSACLQSDGHLYDFATMSGASWRWRAIEWSEGMEYSLRTGQPAFEHIFGQDLWSYFQEHPEERALFQRAINTVSGNADEPIAQVLTETYDLKNRVFVDVGGGIGSLLISVLQRNPTLKGVLFDRAEVIEQAKERIRQANLVERCTLVAGDFFEFVPAEGDYYFMRQIVLDWTDDEGALILQNCRKAMKQGGKILVAEEVLGPGLEDSIGKLTDLILMTLLTGHERDQFEFGQLFAKAGLTLQRTIPTDSAFKIMELS